MKIIDDLKYSKTHEWVKFLDETTVLTGLADYAQEHLGDLVFINMPYKGDEVACGTPLGDIESVKAVSDIYSQVTGVVLEVNEEVADAPQKINEDPYGSWIAKIGDISATADLMDSKEYEKYCQEEE